MLRNILMFLFTKSESRADCLILTIAIIYSINSKYKKSLIILILGGLITTLVEIALGI